MSLLCVSYSGRTEPAEPSLLLDMKATLSTHDYVATPGSQPEKSQIEAFIRRA